MLSAVKNDEDGDGYTVLRLYETGGEDTTAVIDFCGPVKEALPVDINETRQPGAAPAWQGSRLQVPVGAGSVCTLKVRVAYP